MDNKFLGLTPPMGWNSWNTFTWEINDKLIRKPQTRWLPN